ncbi:response regulator [Gracilimonas mengyeensis]|uniref:Response regulator receiver domain-containing protein n=1 Tax=Gracilimonas mengyeensis TaxID=1302730 RepID=A0A521AI95_9BACT|nr:response regulator [Gracilimonas mengyeensis]SMO34536.1 Response regulator receiver domain-containing protein [Gracilimonas mengyeensis]
MAYKVLVIDDDEPIHYMLKNLLKDEFAVLNAHNVQEAIDILSETTVNLILSDIHMPGISGLEFLESIRLDEKKKSIPVLIMTNLPTVEKEKKALDLGAADFIKKELLNNNREKVLDIIRMKIVTDVQVSGLDEDQTKKKDQLVMKLMETAIGGSFSDTVEVLSKGLAEIVNMNYAGFWMIKDDEAELLYSKNDEEERPANEDNIMAESSFDYLKDNREEYLSNHVFNEDVGFFVDFSKKQGLSAEIGVPLFAVNERELLMNNMKVPAKADMFGLIILKRSVLFSSTEFELVSRLIKQSGSILYRLYKKNK